VIDVTRAANGAPRGKGHIADRAPTAPDFAAFRRAHVGASLEPVNMVPFVDRLRDQTITSACVGFAIARAIDIRARITGVHLAYPSARAIYGLARMKEASTPLLDVGCQPSLAIDALQSFGIVGEDRIGFDDARINDPMPWDVFQAGADARLAGAYRLTSSGGQRLEEIRAALAHAYPVVFGMQVDRSYENLLGDPTWHGMLGPSLGGHMQCVINDPHAPPDAFTIAGSWSGWGYGNGLARVGADYLAGGNATDFYVITIAPMGVH